MNNEHNHKQALNVAVVSFVVDQAFITPLSNLVDILFSLSDHVYVITGNKEDVTVKLRQQKIKTHQIYHKGSQNIITRAIRYSLLQIWISRKVAAVSKYIDTCFFFMEVGALLPMLIAKLFRKRIVWVIPSDIINQSTSKNDTLSSVAIYLKSVCYSLADRLIVYSSTLIKDWHLEKYREKIFISYRHFVDLDKFKIQKQQKEKSNLVGYIGRLSEEKGILNFVKAISILNERNEVGFIVGGDGHLKNEIKKYLTENKLSAKVKLLGWIPHDDLPRYLNEMNLLVLPSYTEGLPNIMLEAMACGVPVLANPVGAIPDIIKDGETGFIMENNSPECIAKNVLRALSDPRQQEIAENARYKVEKEFSFEKAVERYRKILT